MRVSFFISVLKNEGRLALRHQESMMSVVLFCLLVVFLFSVSLSPTGITHQEAIPLIWLALLFGGVIRMNRTFEPEASGQMIAFFQLVGGVTLPLFLAKGLLNLLFCVFLAFVNIFLFALLLDMKNLTPFFSWSGIPILLGLFGFTTIGTLFSGLVVGHPKKDLILPLICYPLLMPLILAVKMCFVYSINGDLIGIDPVWIRILIAGDIIYFVASWMLVDYAQD